MERFIQLTASEFSWKLSPQKTIRAWGFNQTLPGPEIRAKKGDTLVIRVTNQLPEATVIHWHGIRLPATMDGTEEVQKPIQPGESFEYRFVVPEAGTFWYHSHKNEAWQMERGMYGSLVVEDELDPAVDADKVLMIDDMKLDKEFQFRKGNMISRWMERHDGREGETLLVNGKEAPVLHMHAGQTERWRIINASSARYLRLQLGEKFRVIATDGGLLEKPMEMNELLIIPGERYDILAGPFSEHETLSLKSLPYNRMTFVKSKEVRLATVYVGASLPSRSFIPETFRSIEPLAPQDSIPDRKVKFSVGPSLKRGIDFLVNNDLHTQDRPVQVGSLQVWELYNASLMDHPFHLHGFFFQVLEVDGVKPAYAAWKDTVNLKPRSRVKIAWIPDNRTGSWMYHCHILEHHAAGMMAHFRVVNGEEMVMEKSHCHTS